MTIEDQRMDAISTSCNRTYRDIEYRKIQSDDKSILIEAYCKKTGYYIGRYEIIKPHFDGDKLSNTAHNYLESVMIKNNLITNRECDLDIQIAGNNG